MNFASFYQALQNISYEENEVKITDLKQKIRRMKGQLENADDK